ncbi:MAG: chromosome segregation protein SMC, partial [Paracoccaceae bacterium]
THDAARTRLADLTAADQAARTARQEADAAMARTRRALSQAEADQTLAHSQLEALSLAAARHKDDAAQATADMAQARTTLAGLGDLESERARIEDMRTATEAARILMVTRRTAHDDIHRMGEARRSRAGQIARDLEGWHARLSSASGRAEDLTTRHAQAQEALAQARRVPNDLASRRRDLADAAETAQTRHHAATEARAQTEDALHKAITAERDAERHASDAREARAASQARAEAAAEVAAQTQQRMWDDTGKTPADLYHDLGEDAAHLPSAHDLEAEVQRLRRKRDALGAVNLRAEDDAAAVQAEHDTLGREKQDLDDAVKTLRAGISGLNREGRERLLAAFDQVNANFGMLFTHLFGGGEANLVMVESEDPLDAGLEIMCQPPGKKLSTLSLLSGGEQTLTALALIFAVFLANPAPICVLDEVDAPLDDANINRFCDMLDDMRSRTDTRFLVITHHAITMARMDRLFGVTMQEQGVSQLVSVDLKRAERMVA